MVRVVVVVVVAAVGSVLVGCSSSGDNGQLTPTGTGVSPRPTTAPPPPRSTGPPPTPSSNAPVTLESAAVVRLTGRSAAGLAVVGGSLWVSHFEGSTLSEVDTATDREVRTVDVGRHPGSIAELGGRVFVAHYGVPPDDRRIDALDPKTNAVDHTAAVGPLCCELVPAAGALWTVTAHGDLIRVDRTLAVHRAAHTAANSDFHIGVVSSGDAVWVASEDSRVERYGADGRRTATVDAGGGIPVAEHGGILWGARSDTLWGLDSTTGEPRATYALDDVSEVLAGEVAGDSLWLAVRDLAGAGRILQIDPGTGTALAEAEISLPTNMAVAGDALWVTDWDAHSVVRFAVG